VREGKLIAISDVHLDTWQQEDPAGYGAKHRAFREFLDWVSGDGQAEHLVIVGDLLDLPPPEGSSLLPLLEDLVNALGELLRAGVMVHYLRGNHDAGLFGIEVQTQSPPLRIGSQALIPSGGGSIVFEHGHLRDAWLGEFVRRKTAGSPPVAAREAIASSLHDGGSTSPEAPDAEAVLDTVFAALQWRALRSGFTAEEQRWGIQVMSQHLDDDFADVADGAELPPGQDDLRAGLARLGLTIGDLQTRDDLPEAALALFAPLGLRYYSALPWRRAARSRLGELRRQHGVGVVGLVTGHTHASDQCSWDCGEGRMQYANCGSWVGPRGDFVSVESGQVASHARLWSDPLP
jgi:UDP-2,3-diacylglucosamine pyrophosphatase LpxH